MYAAPHMLRTVWMGTLPDEIHNEINGKPHLADYQNIIDWCKIRIEQKRQKMLAGHARKGIGQPPINMVQGNSDSDAAEQAHDGSSQIAREASLPAGMTAMAPDIVNELIAALKQGDQTPGRSTDKGSRSP